MDRSPEVRDRSETSYTSHARTTSEMSTESSEPPEVDDGVSYSERGLSPKRDRSATTALDYGGSSSTLGGTSSSVVPPPPGQRQHGQTSYQKSLIIFTLIAIFIIVFVITVGHEPNFREGHNETSITGDGSGTQSPTRGKTTKDGSWLDGYKCTTPFGTIQGTALGVPAMSNCNDSYVSSSFKTIPLFDSDLQIQFGPYITASNQPVNTSNTNSYKDFKFRLFNTSSSYSSHGDQSKETHAGVYTGMEWQCVEFARRFMAVRMGIVFGDVDGATDIWDLKHATSVLTEVLNGKPGAKNPVVPGVIQTVIVKSSSSGQSGKDLAADYTVPIDNNMTKVENFTFTGFQNKLSPVVPQIGDLIIYPKQGGDMPYGHVAVVVGVTLPTVSSASGSEKKGGSITVAEENWTAEMWALKNRDQFSRSIPMTMSETGSTFAPAGAFTLEDPFGYSITGWKRAECPCQ